MTTLSLAHPLMPRCFPHLVSNARTYTALNKQLDQADIHRLIYTLVSNNFLSNAGHDQRLEINKTRNSWPRSAYCPSWASLMGQYQPLLIRSPSLSLWTLTKQNTTYPAHWQKKLNRSACNSTGSCQTLTILTRLCSSHVSTQLPWDTFTHILD